MSLVKNQEPKRYVTGHDFSRADKADQINRALETAEKLDGSGKKCQGTTSVAPQKPQNQRGLYRLRKNSSWPGFSKVL
jgi:hypothetical protein